VFDEDGSACDARSMSLNEAVEVVLRERAGGKCELCGATDALEVMPVPPVEEESAERYVLVCETCAAQIGDEEPLNETHWFCLRDAVWSGVPAVQVTSVRLLQRLGGASWAQDLLGQVYLDEALQAWVDAGASRARADDSEAPTLDSNGAPLLDGDSVTLIKDLDVKGAGFTAKRGTLVKGIKLTGDPAHVEGKVNKTTIVLKTEFLKKAT
jgi:protein PhnA